MRTLFGAFNNRGVLTPSLLSPLSLIYMFVYTEEHDRLLVSITGPSGAGKTTLAKNMVGYCAERGLSFMPVVGATTRSPRTGEQDKVDYYFISHAEFERRAADPDKVVERIELYNQHYGLFRDELERVWELGAVPCVILDPNGVMMTREYCEKHKIIYLPLYLSEDTVKIQKRYLARMVADHNLRANLEYHVTRLQAIERESTEWREKFECVVKQGDHPRVFTDSYEGNENKIHKKFFDTIISIVKFIESNKRSKDVAAVASPETKPEFYSLQQAVVSWASTAFPKRDVHTIIRKLAMNEIPELTIELANLNVGGIARESADILILLMDLCDQLNIDLLVEAESKLEVNRLRSWRVDALGVSHHVNEEEQ